MVTVVDLGPYGMPPPNAVVYTLFVNGIPQRLAFIELPDVPPLIEQLREVPGEPEYWH